MFYNITKKHLKGGLTFSVSIKVSLKVNHIKILGRLVRC